MGTLIGKVGGELGPFGRDGLVTLSAPPVAG